MKIKLIAVLGILLFAFSCGSNQTQINGEIFTIDKNGQTAKRGAVAVKIIKKEKFEKLNKPELSLSDADYTAITDADGKFSVKVPNGEYFVMAEVETNRIERFVSYSRWRFPVNANGGEKKISLDPSNAYGGQSESTF